MNAALIDKQFEFNVWANVQLMETCATLTEEQLTTKLAGTAGTVRETLAHIVDGEGYYLNYLTGKKPWTEEPDWDNLSMRELAELAKTTGDWLLAVASKSDPMKRHERVRDGRPFHFFNHTIVAQAIYHAIEHRTQVKLMLTQLGVEHPELSSWDYTAMLTRE